MASTFQLPPTPNKDDLEGTWAYLEAGVEHIMHNLRDGLNMEAYMGIYTAVHNFCTSQRSVHGNGATIGTPATTHRGAHLLGEDLYRNLKNYLRKHLEGIYEKAVNHADEALLGFYIKEWQRYTTAATFTHNLFRYLNRHWVKREIDEGKKDIFDVYTLHLMQWREELFMKIEKPVINAVLGMVERERNGETIEASKIKSIVDSYVSLGLDDNDATKATLDVYRRYFERPYVSATKTYYEKESAAFVAENPVVEYMKKAEIRLEEEKKRVTHYLHQDIMTPLMKTCLEVLVTAHSALMRDEFQKLLDTDRQPDLARMYGLLARVTGGLEPLRTTFEMHVRHAGEEAVSRIATNDQDIDPKVYVAALLEVHTRYAKLVEEAFNGESEFVRSLDNACKEYVNRNKVCRSNTSKSPELLAKYADSLLKKQSTNVEDNEIEASLKDIMTVFKYVEDKDVFQKFYSRMLAKRLVHTSSASGEAEISMIGKLKEACGYEYTNKLQRMYTDIQTSADLNGQYKIWQTNVLDGDDLKKAVDASYHILGTSFWPLQPPSTPFIPPQDIIKTYERFQKFYLDKHSGRKLTWLWHLSKGEIKANYVKGSKTGYIFQVSTFQMGILLLFNDSDTVTYEQIRDATSLDKGVLDPSIGVLVKAKVILPEKSDAKHDPGPGHVYSLNYDFKHKKMKVNLNIAIKSEQKQEAEETHKTIEEDRKLLMQSAIVRIMKSRKRLKHNLLVTETINQIKSRFQPRVADIKKAIDTLIEKEYLERLEEENLGYLA